MNIQGKRLHLMGIAGAGMTGIAIHAAHNGAIVSGCDPSGSNDELDQAGIKVFDEHSPSHISECDVVGASTAIDNDHPELVEATSQGIARLRRRELLAAITDEKKVISVSGTHGKTTTTAMIGHILRELTIDTSFLVGGKAPTLGGSVGVGNSEFFVLEGDESDASFLGPKVHTAVVTNIEPDHLDFYGSFEALLNAFQEFVQKASVGVVCIDSSNAQYLADLPQVITYGTNDKADFQITDIELEGNHSKATIRSGDSKFEIALSIPGIHAIRNATAALISSGFSDSPEAQTALSTFQNVDRRFSVRSSSNDITVIDDYAHLPSEIEAVIAAARLQNPKRLIVAFQPHRFSRTKELHEQFSESFNGSDEVIVTEIYPAGEAPIAGITAQLIVNDVEKNSPNQKISYIPNRNELVRYLANELQPGDTLLTLGAGDVTKLSDELREHKENGENESG